LAVSNKQKVFRFLCLTPNETKKLQSFPDDFILPSQNNIALKQLGNSVNVEVIKKIILKMRDYAN
jgi:site-specific DNA-cytosine methylase